MCRYMQTTDSDTGTYNNDADTYNVDEEWNAHVFYGYLVGAPSVNKSWQEIPQILQPKPQFIYDSGFGRRVLRYVTYKAFFFYVQHSFSRKI